MNNKKLVPYLMLAPYFFLYISFSLFPIIFSLGISFTKWDGIGTAAFSGLTNYIRVFTKDKFFYQSLRNTVLILCFTTPSLIILGLLTANLLRDFFNKSRSVVQLLNFLPYITTPVAIGIIFQLMFDWKAGIVNSLLQAVGLKSVYWLGIPLASRAVVVFMDIWRQYGYVMVIFLSGLATIPDELYEAAKIDGAKWRHAFFRITVPMLQPIFAFIITTSVINGFRLFDEPQLLFTGTSQPLGGPERAVLTMVMRFYEASFMSFEFGYGSALAYVLFIIIAVVSYVLVRILNRDNQS
jgi:ABC-type sugar transport system permease subunit